MHQGLLEEPIELAFGLVLGFGGRGEWDIAANLSTNRFAPGAIERRRDAPLDVVLLRVVVISNHTHASAYAGRQQMWRKPNSLHFTQIAHTLNCPLLRAPLRTRHLWR
jgi:hypothetical protein